MAQEEPQDHNQQPEDAPDPRSGTPHGETPPSESPEDAVERAGETAGRAAEDIASSPDADAASEAALAVAMAAVNQVKQGVDAAAGEPPAGASPRPPKPDAAGAASFSFRDLGGTLSKGKKETLELLSDVQLNVRIELGRTRMYVEDVLQLGDGAVVELDKLAGDPVDVFVNDRHVARGEVLVLNDNFCVRINEILDPGAETKA